VSEGGVPPVDGLDLHAEAQREKLKRFLPKSEHLIWTGSPQLSRLFLRNVFRTGLMLLLGSVGFYFFFTGTTLTDMCGTQMSKLCRKFYFWPWLGLGAAALYIPFLWLSFILHASGAQAPFKSFRQIPIRQANRSPEAPTWRPEVVRLDGFRADHLLVLAQR
jgi:hypothetical protein